MMCRAFALTRLGCEDRARYVEEISRLKHDLSEALGNLKQSLTANTEYAKKLARAEAEREIVEGRTTEVERQVAEVVS